MRMLVAGDALTAGETAVHSFGLVGDHTELAAFWGMLSTRERERAGQFRRPQDRARFVVAHGWLRLILSRYGGGPPDSLSLVDGPYGKPMLPPPSPLRFSLSHSGTVGLVAVTREREVGIDIEEIRPRCGLRGVAQRFFTAAEVAALDHLAGDDFVTAFYRCWTRKEAYVKGRGLGLRLAPDAFEVGIERCVAASMPWQLVDLDIRPGYAAALAVANQRCR